MNLPNSLVNVRRFGQCLKCHRFRELRVSWNDSMSEVTTVCDACFQCPAMDDEAFDLLYEKAGVLGPGRSLASAFIRRLPSNNWILEQIHPDDG